jgi:RNase H-like domain found in reverse transcriptase
MGGKLYQWPFLQAEVSFPILGVDFLRHYKLLVDVVGGQLIPRSAASATDSGEEVFAVYRHLQQQEAKLTPPAIKPAAAGSTQAPLAAVGGGRTYAQAVKGGIGGSSPAGPPGGPTAAAGHSDALQADWRSIVAEFSGVTQPFTVASSPSHGVQHHIITKGRPVTAKFWRLDPAVLQQRKGQGSRQPLGFFSQKLSPTESRYNAFDHELLAVYSSILHFQHLLEG